METLPRQLDKPNPQPIEESEKLDIDDVVIEKPGYKVNSYAAKKSVAQRMMDIALLTSNSNQLRYVLRYSSDTPSFAVAVSLIIISLALQVAVGLFLIFGTKRQASEEEKDRANSVVVGGVFLITIVNVLVSAFSVEENSSIAPTQSTGLGLRSANFSEYEK